MKVVILGGTGVLSTGITGKCLAAGYEVYHFNRGMGNVFQCVKWIRGNRYCKEDLERAAAMEPDVVIDMLCFHREHAMLAREVFKHKVNHYIYCSTSCVYTPVLGEIEIFEDFNGLQGSCILGGERKVDCQNGVFETKPKSEYGQNKLSAEEEFMKADRDKEFHVTIFRPGHVFGNGFSVNNLTLNGFSVLGRMLRNEKIILTEYGNRYIQACHADNIGQAFTKSCNRQVCYGKVYNVAGEENMTWNEIYRIEKEMLQSKSEIVYMDADSLIQKNAETFDFLNTYTRYDWLQNLDKLKQDIEEYSYEVSFREGMERTIRDSYDIIQNDTCEDKIYGSLLGV